jgi:RNA polymerase sigma factor (sigma-70 family)
MRSAATVMCGRDSLFVRALGFSSLGSRHGMEDVAIGAPVDSRGAVAAGLPLTPDALCQTYADRVYKFALLVSHDSNDAEDLAQDALERAIRGLKTFNPAKGDVEGWLWRIVVNASRDAGRIAGRQRLVIEVLVDRWSADQESADLGDHLGAEQVLEAVRDLSPRHRGVVALRFGADLNYRQVGRALGISEAAALMATRRALANLRARLSQRMDPR